MAAPTTPSIKDLRRAIWDAYKRLQSTPEGVCGKSSEGYCELLYPTFWDCDTPEEFEEPNGVMVYSYALGPSRTHYFHKRINEWQENYYTWHAPDFIAKAIEVVNSWAQALDDPPYSESKSEIAAPSADSEEKR